MGRTKKITQPRHSIARQAALRLIFSLGLFVLLLGISSYKLYSIALQKAAGERIEDLATFYHNRISQQERDWELQLRDFKVRLEVTRLLERRPVNVIDLQAFMTVQGTNRRFQYLLIQDRQQHKVFDFGDGVRLERIPLPAEDDNGWFASNGEVYRVFVSPIWLGGSGNGRIALFYKVDNALLFNLSTPDIVLTALYGGQPLASSAGQSALRRIAEPLAASSSREIPWNDSVRELMWMRIDAPLSVLFSKTELAVSAAFIPIVDGIILWFTLGFWLMRNATRIRELGWAVDAFSDSEHQPSRLMSQRLDKARDGKSDEITEVADHVDLMAEEAQKRAEERHQEEAQRRLWAMVFASSSEAILISDERNRILAVNQAFTKLTGYSEEDVLGRNPSLLSSGRESTEFYAEMWGQLRETGCWSGELYDRRKDGSTFPKWLTINVVHDDVGRITNYVGVFYDITERKEHEERLSYLANYDALTNLPNRHLLLNRLQSAIALSQRSGQGIALLFLDLDNFKRVNDSLGHAVGDQLLIAIATRLCGVVRASDTVARHGGDEFVVMLSQVDGSAEISGVVEKIIEAVVSPVEIGGHVLHVTTSIGISLYPGDGQDTVTLMKHADTAMYAAKAAGKNQARYFDAQMNRNALERLTIEYELRRAMSLDELRLHFQPKLCLAANSLCGAEALIRWQHPRYGLIGPGKFIPVAEESALIIEIGEWVIRKACQHIVEWSRERHAVGRIAINLSALQLESDSFVDSVQRILAETGVPPYAIEFELTESMVLRNPERSVTTLKRLRQLGICLALDDFGTGYSSLSYLKRLPVDIIKIDRSFVEGVPNDADDSQIVRMIIALAKSVRLEVVAEGIETDEQLQYLKQLECDFVQGYLIAKPLPEQEFLALMAARETVCPYAENFVCQTRAGLRITE